MDRSVLLTSLLSWQFAPSTAKAIGMPCPSVSRLRLTPDFARSVGFLPVFSPPNGALVIAPSIHCHVQSSSFFSSICSSPAFHIFLKTLAPTHCWNRRCTVLPAPRLRGSAFHWQPVRSTYKMAVIALRLSIGGRPRTALCFGFGRSGSIRSQSLSERQYRSSIPNMVLTIFPSQRKGSTTSKRVGGTSKSSLSATGGREPTRKGSFSSKLSD